MKTSSLSDGQWASIVPCLSAVADLDATARAFGAFQRRGRVSDPVGVLRLALMYGLGGLSLRGTAAAAEGLVGSLSDKAVEGRLRKAGPWLEHLLECLLRARMSRAGKRAVRKSAKNRTKVDPRTLKAANYVMLLTSLPADQQGAKQVTELYRTRWQVELGFKRLKTLSGIDALPSADPRLAKTWLLAHLIVAVLTEDLTKEVLGFPPSKADATVSFTLERLGMGTQNDTPRHLPKAKVRKTAQNQPNP